MSDYVIIMTKWAGLSGTVKIAEENEVAVVENVPLARALYASVEVGMEIPKEFYNPVAEILAHIYSKDESESAQRVNAV